MFECFSWPFLHTSCESAVSECEESAELALPGFIRAGIGSGQLGPPVALSKPIHKIW